MTTADVHQFVEINFDRFKAFRKFSLKLRKFNILVGPNNSGKSTILAAFRILAAAMRSASRRSPVIIKGPSGEVFGYKVDLTAISVAEENLFYNYDDSEVASVTFKLSNGNELQLYFPDQGTCYLIPEAQGKPIRSPAAFKSNFKCPIGFVPILGPVEHNERLVEKETARRALFSYTAARNFRNIWYYFPEKFEAFRQALIQTWPGMDIERPIVDRSHEKPCLHMFCPEERIPREVFWAGFGFQVWCQMLTHVIQSADVALFLIDEPDIYLHSDLQRQLLGLLRNMGADILIATHSTEIITEAEADDIILVDKRRSSARRVQNPGQLESVFATLGSNLNPILTQLAKTRRAVFVEGKDFQILGRFAQKVGTSAVSARRDFAIIPVGGFNPERIKDLKSGMEVTLGRDVLAAAILDRDFRGSDECASIVASCETFCSQVTIHARKEIENFLLVPAAIERAVERRLADRMKRTGKTRTRETSIESMLATFCAEQKSYVTAQFLSSKRQFCRREASTLSEATIAEAGLIEFEALWNDPQNRLNLVPGKDALRYINTIVQAECDVTATATAIIDAMTQAEVPSEMRGLIGALTQFASCPAGKSTKG